ncbi:hypothetical protein [Micromonospora sp. M71_S20]|uniref:hypothetical protein n=1 Tax=Micromonospora sp. M71_S20 TaxID=592872 RepID=UPI0011E5B0C8|nr:hypothetical protein [Micromonospora sp. M71_S20]
MTAAPYSIMAVPASTQPAWRLRWAERENERRRRAYDARSAAWQRRHDHLVRLRIEAAGFLGCTQPRAGLPVALDDDEVVYRVLPVADLIEVDARHGTRLPAPGLTVATDDVAGRALPRGARVLDTGLAVVTSRRVAFSSERGRRHEWRYADLVGPAHHRALPLTLLHATDGRRLAGLRVPAAGTVNFRFYLTLAFAAATGGRAVVTAQLEALLAAHRRARPVPPPPVRPDQAPSSGLRAEPRAALAAAVVAVAFVALAAAGTAAPERVDPPYRAEAARRSTPAVTSDLFVATAPAAATPDLLGATVPAVSGGPVAWRTGAARSGAGALVPPVRIACPPGGPGGPAAPATG